MPAKAQAVTNPNNTLCATKHFFGLEYDDPEIQKDINNILFKIAHDANGGALVETHEKFCSLSHIETFMWMRIKQTEENMWVTQQN